MTAYVIGLDLGTTSTKAVALSADGEILALATAQNRMWSDQAGGRFQDPEDVWNGVPRALADLAVKIGADDALGMCLSGAMHSLFPANSSGRPLAPAVTWADVRAGKAAASLRGQCDAHALYLRTGCPLQYLYYPAKIQRWLEERPEWGQPHFAAIKDFVYHRLTGSWATDQGLASATGLMDTHTQTWDAEALALAGISACQLPELVSPIWAEGKLRPEIAPRCGYPAGLPVVIGAGDGGLANLGSGAILPGESVITVGTSGAVRRIADHPVMDEFERTWCYLLVKGRWFHGGASNNAGLAVQWVRERFYNDMPEAAGYAELFQRRSRGAGRRRWGGDSALFLRRAQPALGRGGSGSHPWVGFRARSQADRAGRP